MDIHIKSLGLYGLIGAFTYCKEKDTMWVCFKLTSVIKDVDLVQEINAFHHIYPDVSISVVFI